MGTNLFEALIHCSDPQSLIDFLNGSSCDEMLEVDLGTDSYRHVYHVVGKYFTATTDGSYSDLYRFTYGHVVHPDDLETYADLMDPATLKQKLQECETPYFRYAEFRYKLEDGAYRWVQQCVIGGSKYGFADDIYRIYVFDIENQKSREIGASQREAAGMGRQKDPETGLIRSNVFFDVAQARLEEEPSTKWCILSIDIEHFKLFDDWYGHEEGDKLLKELGIAISRFSEEQHGLGGYLGQDDFILLIPYDEAAIRHLYSRLRNVIGSYGQSAGFLPAIGVYLFHRSIHIAEAFDRASLAAAHAKQGVRNRISIYDPEMHMQTEREYKILSDFMTALRHDEITFYLQPQCRISTKCVVGAESLCRWIKPNGQMVPPINFIPVLEKYGFITDLDKYIWEKVCRLQRNLLDQGSPIVPISVNVSQIDIYTIDVPKYFSKLLSKYSLPAEAIKVEITESAYAESYDLIHSMVMKLREMGIMVLLDDFGTGYSSLNLLGSINVDAIKLDATFINQHAAANVKGIQIVESIVNMAKNLALPIIVEGVENQNQTDFLVGLGCRYVQGYYFYKPMPIADFEKLISDDDNLDHRGFVVKLNEQFRLREFMDQNIYSDSMLNNVLGAVAIYLWHGDENVDIIRFNQQFYESVNVPDFHSRLTSIQRFLPEGDGPIMYAALKEAMENKLNGSACLLHFYKTDGTLTSYEMRFYYVGEQEEGHRFYGCADNETAHTDLQAQLQYIGEYSTDSFVFLKRVKSKTSFTVAAHGLADAMGLSKEEFEKELNDNTFYNRIDAKQVAEYDAAPSFELDATFTYEFTMKNTRGEIIEIALESHPIPDVRSNFSSIIIFHQKKAK